MTKLERLLRKYQTTYAPVLPDYWQRSPALILDLSGNDAGWTTVDLTSIKALRRYTQSLLTLNKAKLAIGRYGEDRKTLYTRGELFSQAGGEVRSTHLGIDLTVPANTPIFAPIAGKVHSFNNNQGIGNYGPTIILEHVLENIKFFTLYGHLSVASLKKLTVTQVFDTGEQIGKVGSSRVNGHWPAHLHFQIITDMQNNWGDFPGVIDQAQKQHYLDLCPDPNLILQINELAN